MLADTGPCGILHDKVPSCTDTDGCILPTGHDGPHEFIAADGVAWQWETDLECTCEWCMRCEGDYCTVYWKKADSGGEIEFQSWLAELRATAGVSVTPHKTFRPSDADGKDTPA